MARSANTLYLLDFTGSVSFSGRQEDIRMPSKSEYEKSVTMLRAMLNEAKPSAVSEHRFDEKGLEIKLKIPNEKLTASGARELLSLLMSDLC
jgi:hypothetical protein